MHGLQDVLSKLYLPKAVLLVDGNDFKPFTYYYDDEIIPLDYYCIKGGDNQYSSIAAASIRIRRICIFWIYV